MKTFLDTKPIEELFRAATEADLTEQRPALFAGIHKVYKASIHDAGSKLAQLRVDLASLNSTTLADGTVPFRTWLRNAVGLAGFTEQGSVFTRIRRELDLVLLAPLGPEAQAIFEALSDLSDEDLTTLLRTGLPARVSAFELDTLETFELVRVASAEGWRDRLLTAALAQQTGTQGPSAARIADLALRTGILPQVPLAPSALEDLIHRRTPFQDVAVWASNLARAIRPIARVELEEDGRFSAAGTGFLVAPDLLLTNYHVIEPLLGSPATGRLRFRFDFQRSTDGLTLHEGLLTGPAPGLDWHVLSSPYSQADLADDPAAEPSPAELDFALLRLAEPLGDRPVTGAAESAPRRSWLRLAADTALTHADPGENLLILQHPEGAPLQIAFGAFTRLFPRRFRYTADTAHGSSGSPCFDAAFHLVALHHSGDPKYATLKRSEYNQGIPAHLIAAACAEKGIPLPAPP
ncbi:MAG: trypsin-like peptidase domain-containing protein [Polyangiaceae bacterium]